MKLPNSQHDKYIGVFSTSWSREIGLHKNERVWFSPNTLVDFSKQSVVELGAF